MTKLFIKIFFISLFSIVTNLFAGNDTVENVKDYIYNFENSSEVALWQFKHSSGKNEWIIHSYDDSNSCLYISHNGQDTIYSTKSSSISIAYKKVLLSNSDSLILEFDLNIGGEGSSDYLKVMLLPETFDLSVPSPSSSSLGFVGAYYKTNSFIFDDGNVYISDTKGKKHIMAKIKNSYPFISANLVFIWRNDNTTGKTPGAIVDNIILGGSITHVDKSLCKGEYFSFNNKNVNETGIYYDTIPITENCSSFVQYDVIVYDTFIKSCDIVICEDENYILHDGTILENSGHYVDNMQTIYGCDSVINIDLIVNTKFNTTIYDTICSNEQYDKNGFSVNQSGLYFDTLKAQNSCDSLVELLLTVNNAYEKTYLEMICMGEVFNKYGFNESNSGFYTHNYQTIKGCDSIIHLNLKVSNEVLKDIYDTICDGEIYSQNGFTETQNGVYVDSLQTLNGCDSIVKLHLRVNPTYVNLDSVNEVEICQGESIEFNGKTLTTSGYYKEMLQTEHGCDSMLQVSLKVNPVYWITDSVTIENGKKYKWNGKTYSKQGNYTDTLLSIKGCDSIVTLCLSFVSSFLKIDSLRDIIIFPNPTSEAINLKIQIPANKIVILLINTLGETLRKLQFPANQKEISIDIRDIQKGNYILWIDVDDNIFQTKIIIE